MRPVRPVTARTASNVPATYGAADEPASCRIDSRSSGSANTISVETVKLGSRTEWTCVPAMSAPRASTAPWVSASERSFAAAPSVSASSRAVPLGASALPALA